MLRYTLYEIRRSVLSPSSVFYTIILPVGLYMLFGALQDYAKVKVADGNASAYVMIGMALYGAISSTVSVSGLTVVENVAGWGRQLALTPMNTGKYLFSKCCVAFVMAAVPVIAVNIAARLTGIDMPLNQQIACAALSILCAMVFGFFGLAIGLLVPSESAVGIANGVLVALRPVHSAVRCRRNLPLSLHSRAHDYQRQRPRLEHDRTTLVRRC